MSQDPLFLAFVVLYIAVACENALRAHNESQHQMFKFEDGVKKAESDRIANLDLSAFSDADVVNLVLQRSEIIRDRENHNRYIKDWINGNDRPILGLIGEIGADTLIQRAAGFILLEYEELRDELSKMNPTASTDIGCGYAIFDLFLAQDVDCKITLIDLESSDGRHFGFKQNGSAYSNLEVATEFLARNGISKRRIKTLNPKKDPVDETRGQDLAYSFISCGFHYPWATYETFFKDAVIPGGNIILDVRRAHLDSTLKEMAEIGKIRKLNAGFSNKAARIVITKH